MLDTFLRLNNSAVVGSYLLSYMLDITELIVSVTVI